MADPQKIVRVLLDEIDRLKAANGALSKGAHLGKLTYFNLMAKGLQVVLCLETSGMDYDARPVALEEWGGGLKKEMMASGAAPFGQLPVFEAEGMVLAQATALCSYIGKRAGTDGKDAREFAISSMLMAEGEDVFNGMLQAQPNCVHPASKGTREENDAFWQKMMDQMDKLERILEQKASFTTLGKTVGELYLWGMLYQAKLVKPELLGSCPYLAAWHASLSNDPAVRKCVAGQSKLGPLKQFFLPWSAAA